MKNESMKERFQAVKSFFARKNQSEYQVRSENHVNRKVFWAIVQKEFTDYVTSWRIIILLAIILLTCVGSLYTAITSIEEALKASEEAQAIARDLYLYVQMFTISDGTLPNFISFVGFLGPLLGVALGFDAINSERNKGTLSRLMAQPIPRDYVINGKFVAAVLLNILLFFSLGLLVMAFGILILGVPPTFDEFLRVICFLIVCIVYIAFWLNLGILFSIVFRQPATSALAGLAVWLFFIMFYQMIIEMLTKSYLDPTAVASEIEWVSRQEVVLSLMRLSPNYLFSESTIALLSPAIRTLGPYTYEQTLGQVASPLQLDQSLLIIWPQCTGLIAGTLICFTIAYLLFTRQEIRSN